MRTLCCGSLALKEGLEAADAGFVLVTSLAGAVPTIGLSRRHGGRRLTDEARAAWAIESEPRAAEVYGDLTTLMAFHVDVLAS